MIKKLLAVLLTTAGMVVPVFAGSVYLGPALLVQDNMLPSSNFRGIHPRLSLGYYTALEDMYLAGEVFAAPFTATLEDNYNGPSNNSAKTTRSFGASIIPGAYINDCVIGYLRLGANYAKFTGPGSWRSGAHFGLGLQIELTRYWDMRAEYIYTAYHRLSPLGSPKSDEAGLGFIYKVLS